MFFHLESGIIRIMEMSFATPRLMIENKTQKMSEFHSAVQGPAFFNPGLRAREAPHVFFRGGETKQTNPGDASVFFYYDLLGLVICRWDLLSGATIEQDGCFQSDALCHKNPIPRILLSS